MNDQLYVQHTFDSSSKICTRRKLARFILVINEYNLFYEKKRIVYDFPIWRIPRFVSIYRLF